MITCLITHAQFEAARMTKNGTTGRQVSAAPAIELVGISKSFGPVQANKNISIRVMPGTIHGIIGENGAGKSTLMSILYGFYKADKGDVLIAGNKMQIPDSQAAIAAGIGMVFQHFKLVPNFSVLENIILGAEDGAMPPARLGTNVPIHPGVWRSACARNCAKQQRRHSRIGYCPSEFVQAGLRCEIVVKRRPYDRNKIRRYVFCICGHIAGIHRLAMRI